MHCNESTQFITGHVIYNPAYNYKFQLKTTNNLFLRNSKRLQDPEDFPQN